LDIGSTPIADAFHIGSRHIGDTTYWLNAQGMLATQLIGSRHVGYTTHWLKACWLHNSLAQGMLATQLIGSRHVGDTTH